MTKNKSEKHIYFNQNILLFFLIILGKFHRNETVGWSPHRVL